RWWSLWRPSWPGTSCDTRCCRASRGCRSCECAACIWDRCPSRFLFLRGRLDERRIIQASGGPMPDCMFCRIAARQSPADVVYEDDDVVAFKDIYPKAPVHFLIVPKRHIASLLEARDEDAEVLGRCLLAARRL